nr:craniofacial development protein 2-like [Penaeus vannamei]
MPDRESPESPRAAPTAVHKSGGEKYATGTQRNRIRVRNNITLGTWSVKTLKNRQGKVLKHEMNRYRWNILGLYEVRWKNIGEISTQEGHRLSYSGSEDRHEQDAGVLVHNGSVNAVRDCRPLSSQLITIRLRATPFNITIVQAYAKTTTHSEVGSDPQNDILVVHGEWNDRIGEDGYKNWKGTCGSHCNPETNG